ncbi:hypothetical protein SRB5_42390 [Streptomyces sp. RB5]|uniref:DUF2690 domain-containing protein n=1 Tax=Streptomyces smaragdinus TaxID=2585196 RepID=A0A7K0CKS0_9ACTN|nr:hypothetical protein [Streptomyces smaragdinus]
MVTVVGAVLSVVLTLAFTDDGKTADRATPSPTPTTPSPTCSGSGCTGLDPKDAHCDTGAVTIAENWAATLHVEIRYSRACHAVWGKLTGGEVGDTVEIRTSPSTAQLAAVQFGHDKYTPMLGAPADFTAQATAVAVNTDVERKIPTGHAVRAGADAADLPAG